jgi:tetratricopeptide (TPR) repeat protein
VRTPAPAPPVAPAEEPELTEEEIDLEATEEEIDLEVEESGLDASSVESDVPAGLPAFELDEELSDEELPPQFIDEEPEAQPFGGSAEQSLIEEPIPQASADPGLALGDALELTIDEEPEPPPPSASQPSGDIVQSASATMPVITAPAFGRPKTSAPARPPAVAEAPASGLPSELQKVLDEVDSYVALGFVDDAKDALQETETRFPRHPALLRKMQELGLEPEAAAPVEPEPPPPPAPPPSPIPESPFEAEAQHAGDDPFRELTLEEPEPEEPVPSWSPPPPESEPAPPVSLFETAAPEPAVASDPFASVEGEGGVDLGAELGELFGTQSAVEEAPLAASSTDFGDSGLADIFKEFKKGVDKQLSKEDYDTRYNLGIAYKEMGLVDEAIAEFQLAAKDEGRMLECSSMLGICFMEKGLPKLAVKWFEKGLKAPGRNDEEYQGLRYDLAMALEAAGERDRALTLFTDLYGQDANFRDVAMKVRDLRAALG